MEARRNTASAAFVREVRRVLQQLYDPAGLSSSPLLELLSVERGNSPASLRQVLLEGIESLRPASGVPPQANAWRIYRILLHRYIEQTPQREVATSLALSVRQLRRQQNLSVKVLADYLWRRYALADKPFSPAPLTEQPDDWEQECEWLRTSQPSDLASIGEMIQGALTTVGPLLKAGGVGIINTVSEDLPRVVTRTITMRQALVNVLTLVARHIPNGQIELGTTASKEQVTVRVHPVSGLAPISPFSAEDLASLEMTRQLVALSGGMLTVLTDGARAQPFTMTLSLQIMEHAAVLLIDDNPDTLQLFRRYLADSRYRLIEAHNPQRALDVATSLLPSIIILDVMLPGIDGWELLGRLREHPATRQIPVIVCTVLRQEQLALTLGAAAFLQKPVSRETLLQALAAQLEHPQPDAR